MSETPSRLPGLTVAPGKRPGIPDAAMQCTDQPIPTTRLTVLDGAIPEGIGGHAFFSGPRARVGYPIWGSEALIWRIDFAEDGASLTKQFVRNPQWWASDAIDEDGWFDGLCKGLFTFQNVGAGFFMSALLGVQDMQNIAPIPFSSRVMAVTSDNGRPWILDPDSLDVVRPLGNRKDWKPGLDLPWPFGMFVTTAHPVLDADDFDDPHLTGKNRHVYTTNFMPQAPLLHGFTHLLRWDIDRQQMEHFRLIDSKTGEPLVINETLHQLQVTKNHVILLESAFQVNFWLLMLNFLTKFGVPSWVIDKLTSNPDYPFARFWVIKKSDLALDEATLAQHGPDNPKDVQAVPVPIAGESWHFVTAYDDDDGIVMFVLHTPTADISHYIGANQPMLDGSRARAQMDGFFTNYALQPGQLGLHTLRTTEHGDYHVSSLWGAAEEHTWGLGVHAYRYQSRPWLAKEMPRIYMSSGGFYRGGVPRAFYELYEDRAPRVEELPEEEHGSVFSVDPNGLAIDGWKVPRGWVLWSPTYLAPGHWADGAFVEDHDAAQTRGHLAVFAVSDPTADLPEGSSGTELWIFDAGDLDKGPVCRLGLPDLQVGVTVHSCWVDSTDTFTGGVPWDVESDFDLDAMEEAWRDVVPDWVPLSRVWKKVVTKAVKWKETARMFEEVIFPKYRD